VTAHARSCERKFDRIHSHVVEGRNLRRREMIQRYRLCSYDDPKGWPVRVALSMLNRYRIVSEWVQSRRMIPYEIRNLGVLL